MSDEKHTLTHPNLPGQPIRRGRVSIPALKARGWRHECCQPTPHVTDTPVNAPAEPVNPEPVADLLDLEKE